MAYLAKVIAQKCSGIAVADGAIATGAWLVNMAAAAGRTGSIAPSLGFSVTLTGIVFGIAATAATGAFGINYLISISFVPNKQTAPESSCTRV